MYMEVCERVGMSRKILGVVVVIRIKCSVVLCELGGKRPNACMR